MKRAIKPAKHPGVAELKANFSSYLRRVKAGNDVVITERGLPVAKLVPLKALERAESRQQRLVKAGLLLPPSGKMPAWLSEPPAGKTFSRAGASVLAALIEERREGR